MEGSAANEKNNLKPLSSKEKAEIKSDIYKDLQLPATSGSIRFFPGGKKSWLPRTVAAAVFLISVGSAVYFWFRPAAPDKAGSATMITAINEIKTGRGELKKILLEDSTLVTLNANSTLRYKGFGKDGRREVEVEGNAFFSVKKDPHYAPFVIRANALAVTVLGTELNVNARSAETQVELASGKIKIEHKKNIAYLEPGEKIKFDTTAQVFRKMKMNPALYYAWTKGQWNFHQSTLEEIASLINEYYGMETGFISPEARKLRINAVIPVSNLEDLVSVIEHTLPVNIKISQNQLIVQ